MGEAIITSRGGTQEEAIPIVPGCHSILVTVKDYKGELLRDYPINCKDGTHWYNYKTNESGKVLFTCNSGAANISINNVVNGYRYLDFPNHIMNCDAPIGGKTKLAFNIPKTTTKSFNFGKGTSKVRFLYNQKCSGYIVGGGGGGSAAANSAANYTGGNGGSGGGGGYLKEFNNYNFNANQNYNIFVGSGGIGGQSAITYSEYADGSKIYRLVNQGAPGNSGGSSTISGTTIAANGGSGGQNGLLARARTNGFGYGGDACNNGGSSGSVLGGGGGGGEAGLQLATKSGSYYSVGYGRNNAFTIGGAPYGGNSGNARYENAYNGRWYEWRYTSQTPREDGKGPGGGGGAGAPAINTDSDYYVKSNEFGGNGAAGICVINLANY